MNEKIAAARFLQPPLAPASAAEICDMLEYPADRKLGDVVGKAFFRLFPFRDIGKL